MTEQRYKEAQELLKEMNLKRTSIRMIDKMLGEKIIQCVVHSVNEHDNLSRLGYSIRIGNCEDRLRNFLSYDKIQLEDELKLLQKQFDSL